MACVTDLRVSQLFPSSSHPNRANLESTDRVDSKVRLGRAFARVCFNYGGPNSTIHTQIKI
jgi:hypothetical protein